MSDYDTAHEVAISILDRVDNTYVVCVKTTLFVLTSIKEKECSRTAGIGVIVNLASLCNVDASILIHDAIKLDKALFELLQQSCDEE